MEFKYILLKSSWGIAVTIDMIEIRHDLPMGSDYKINDKIILRAKGFKHLTVEQVCYWVGKGIEDLATSISAKLPDQHIIYDLRSVDFSYTDFQLEGLYCAAQGWLGQYYDFEFPDMNVFFDKIKNKYVFPDLQKYHK